MLNCTHTAVMNLENALRGMRNPLQSWAKSDSHPCDAQPCPCEHPINPCGCGCYLVGSADRAIAERLIRAGSDERKFMRQIFVSVDIAGPLYWWKEFDTYKVGTVANSTSTMHKLMSRPLTREDFSTDGALPEELSLLDTTIAFVNALIERYKTSEDPDEKKNCFRSAVQILPCSYNQLRTVTLNYENLINIFHARKAHKLTEWHTFCDWVCTLPYASWITG